MLASVDFEGDEIFAGDTEVFTLLVLLATAVTCSRNRGSFTWELEPAFWTLDVLRNRKLVLLAFLNC